MCRQRESLPGRTEAGAGTDAGLGVISEGEGNYDPHHDGEDGDDDDAAADWQRQQGSVAHNSAQGVVDAQHNYVDMYTSLCR